MHFYKRHIGDYARTTKLLSMAEHGALNLLLDYYYGIEGPIHKDCVDKIALARTKNEKNLVKNVLKNYFFFDGEFYRNERADREIEESHKKSKKRKAAAEARWRQEKENQQEQF